LFVLPGCVLERFLMVDSFVAFQDLFAFLNVADFAAACAQPMKQALGRRALPAITKLP